MITSSKLFAGSRLQNRTILLFVASLCATAAHAAPGHVCTYSVGETISPKSFDEFVGQGAATGAQRGEFETTEEFEARTGAATAQQLVAGETVILQMGHDPENIIYDADSKRFAVQEFAWGNSAIDYGDYIPGLPTLSYDGHAEGWFDYRVVDTYVGTNAYGAETTVSVIEGARYHLFDEVGERDAPTWPFDFLSEFDSNTGDFVGNGIYVPVRRDIAEAMKNDMRFAIEFTPRTGEIISGTNSVSATMDDPRDRSERIFVFQGSLDCLYATDSLGQVYRAVPSIY